MRTAIFILASILSPALMLSQALNIRQLYPVNAPQVTNIPDAQRDGTHAVADVDGDGDLDILITGNNNAFVDKTRLYLNDGNGNLSLSPFNNFLDLTKSSAEFADVDGDNDPDLLLTGRDGMLQKRAVLYINNGAGNFGIGPSAAFVTQDDGAIAFGDVDGDNDLDVILAGNTLNVTPAANLYLNNGSGQFSLVSPTPFAPTREGDVTLGDVDGDNDLDVIFIGEGLMGALTQLYLNDGSGGFTLDASNSFTNLTNGEAHFFDYDNDADQDLIISGEITGSGEFTGIYLNNGSGSFSLLANAPLLPLEKATIALGDLDGNNYIDIFLSGQDSTGFLNSQLLYNSASGFVEDTISKLDGVVTGTSSIADFNGDVLPDLYLTGDKFGNIRISKLFINQFIFGLIEAGGSYVEGIYAGDMDSADVDADGDLDLFICGRDIFRHEQSLLYLNDGAGNFSVSNTGNFAGVASSSCRFGDFDGDMDFDLVLMGRDEMGSPVAEIYFNDGAGNFTASAAPSGLESIYDGDFLAEDFDGDGDLDIVSSGRKAVNFRDIGLFLNNGSGVFTEKTSGVPFTPVDNTAMASADVDLDGDMDIIITGQSATQTYRSELFLNDGAANFSLAPNQSFMAVRDGAVDFSDYDADGDMDLLLMGQNSSLKLHTIIYENDSTGNFTPVINNLLPLYLGDASWQDLNGDGSPDILLSGFDSTQVPRSVAYRNDGGGVFSAFPTGDLRGVYFSKNLLGDFDQNGALDIWQFGINNSGQFMTYRYEAGGCLPLSGVDSIVSCDSLQWIDGNTYYASNDTATFTLPGAQGCDSIVLLNLHIPVFDTTVVMSIANVSIQSLDTNSTYQWINCADSSAVPGANQSMFVATATGNYAVVLTQGTCRDTSSCYMLFGQDIGEFNPQREFELYPNPSNGTLKLDLGLIAEEVEVLIYTLSGQEVYRSLAHGVQSLELSTALPQGHYMLRVISQYHDFRSQLIEVR